VDDWVTLAVLVCLLLDALVLWLMAA